MGISQYERYVKSFFEENGAELLATFGTVNPKPEAVAEYLCRAPYELDEHFRMLSEYVLMWFPQFPEERNNLICYRIGRRWFACNTADPYREEWPYDTYWKEIA